MRAARPALAALLLAALPGACSDPDGSEEAGAAPGSAFELRPVVRPAMAALEAELAAQAPPPRREEDPEELRERILGLVTLIAGSDASLRAVGLDEVAGIGAAAVAPLEELLRGDPPPADDERAAALEMLARVDAPESAELLLSLVETGTPAWVRTHAAWRLGAHGHDFVVPRLLLRLKYETDHDCVIWIAAALARAGNYAGLGVLGTVARTSPSEELRRSALARTAEIAAAAGFEDPQRLWKAWLAGDPEGLLPARAPSPRLQLEVWRTIDRLREYQLRGVDDARYVLELLAAPAAGLLGQALHEDDVYVRVGTAQSLERMGPRGAAAGPELVSALAEPVLAPHAAAALGSVGHAPGEAALLRCLAPDTDPELFLAAVRALGGFPRDAGGAVEAEAQLRALVDEPSRPEEVRQAAAESLLARGAATPELVAALCGWLTSPRVDPATTERALGAWLARLAEGGSVRAEEVLAAWDAAGTFDALVVPAERRRAARAERAELVRAAQPELLEDTRG